MERIIAALLFFLISLLTLIDMIVDYRKGGSTGHLLTEGTVTILGILGALALLRQTIHLRKETRRLRDSLGISQAEVERWKRENLQILKGLGAAIDTQFERWGLTPAEKEVGLLLLKGLSLKEVADLRKTSERTVRQQAGEIYRKAGLKSRSEFSAFFLEDLLLPLSDQKHSKN